MDKHPKISVIVAVYNAEKYLRRCIDSLLAQTFTDFEVLLIDDGSTDESVSICDDYAERDKRCRVFHNSNQGIGSTRHFGILHARGEYTIHADSDDWVEENMFEEMIRTAERSNADIVICDYFENHSGIQQYKIQKPTSLDPHCIIYDLLTFLGGICWNKLIKLDCYKANGINFIKGLNYGEDLVTIIRMMQYPLKVDYLPKAFYHYDQTANGSSYTKVMSRSMLQQREDYIQYLFKYTSGEQAEKLIAAKYVIIAYYAIKMGVYSTEEFIAKYQTLKKYQVLSLRNISFEKRGIVWIALHVSYKFSLLLMRIKKNIGKYGKCACQEICKYCFL